MHGILQWVGQSGTENRFPLSLQHSGPLYFIVCLFVIDAKPIALQGQLDLKFRPILAKILPVKPQLVVFTVKEQKNWYWTNHMG